MQYLGEKIIAVSRRHIIEVSRRKIIAVARRKIIAVARRNIIAVSRRKIIAVSRQKINAKPARPRTLGPPSQNQAGPAQDPWPPKPSRPGPGPLAPHANRVAYLGDNLCSNAAEYAWASRSSILFFVAILPFTQI